MRDRRSTLESINAGRRRRVSTALDDLDHTLGLLEGRLEAAAFEARHERHPHQRLHEHDDWHESASVTPAVSSRDDIAHEMHQLREGLRQQMDGDLHREFAALKSEIEHALKAPVPLSRTDELHSEFERLSAMMRRLSEKREERQARRRPERESPKNKLAYLERDDRLHSFAPRWDESDRRFNKNSRRPATTRAVTAPPATSHIAAADPMLKALAARVEEISSAVAALPTTNLLRSLDDKIKIMQSAVDRFARQQEQPNTGVLDAIEERLDELSRAVAISVHQPRAAAFDPEPFERLEARISLLARQIGEAVQGVGTDHLSDQLAALSHRLEDLAQRIDLPEQAIERLARQISTIADRLDHAPALPNLDTVFHGLENRLASMANLLEHRHEDALAHGRALFHDLEARIDDVASRLDAERPVAGREEHLISVMDARFAELAAHFERQAAAAMIRDDGDALHNLEDRLERRLEVISSRIEASASVDPDLIRSLEAQISGLAAQIAQPPAHDERDDLHPRLDRIEQSLAGSKHDVLEAARQAAEEAVRNFSGNAAEVALVAALADDLKSLEALTRRSDDRNAKTFEAIHDTLLKIVERLGEIEEDRESRAATSAQAPLSARSPIPLPDAAIDATLSPEADASPKTEPGNKSTRDMVLETARTPSLAPADETLATVVASPLDDDAGGKADGARTSLLGGLARALKRSGKADTKARKSATTDTIATDAMNSAAEPAALLDAPAVELDSPYDPGLANQPLEPGSGTPDLNAIMRRVRDERVQPAPTTGTDASRADFIAAARRAAQAAAVEAEALKSKQGSGAQDQKSGSSSLFKSRRKPLLMGAVAILIALAGLQGSRILMSDGGPSKQATAPVPSATETVAATQAHEDEGGTAPIAAPQPTVEENSRAQLSSPQDSEIDADTAWLDMETTTATGPASKPAPAIKSADTSETMTHAVAEAEPDETELQQTPDMQAVAAIPVDAGPIALREAAAAGDPKALYEIGNRYAEGRGVAENMARAVEWYEQAAAQGLAPAQYRVGSLYEKGIGTQRDVAAAKRWYEQAAESGNASAMHNLAVLHAMGADGKTDNNAAARWFQQAAELGVRDSQFNLGILAAKGVGMPQNLSEAYKWFALVAKAGDKDAADKRDEIAGALRPEQLETARAAADLWRAHELDAQANIVEIPESWSESPATTAGIDMHAAMRNIQKILNANGYDAGAEDGVMGQKTRAAIAAFQQDNDMAATGDVDEALVRALLEKG